MPLNNTQQPGMFFFFLPLLNCYEMSLSLKENFMEFYLYFQNVLIWQKWLKLKNILVFVQYEPAPHQLCKPFAAYVLIFSTFTIVFIALFPLGFMFCLYTLNEDAFALLKQSPLSPSFNLDWSRKYLWNRK